MSKFNIFPKPLKGGSEFLSDILDPDSIASILNSGIEMNNVVITGGTIDGVIIGQNNPLDGYFTNLFVSNNTSTSTITDLNSITFNSGSNITETSGDLIFNASNSVIINNPLQVNDNTTIVGDLTVIGTIFGVPVAPPLGMTIEHISQTIPNSLNCSNALNISYVTFTGGSGISTGNLNVASFDGFYKIITIIGIPTGGEYHLTVTNLLDPMSQIISNKIIKFKYSGQGIVLIYSLPDNCYTIVPGGSV